MRLMTAVEVATVLSVTVSRVYELTRDGILPGVRLGRQVRWDEDILAEFVRGGGRTLEEGWRRERSAQR